VDEASVLREKNIDLSSVKYGIRNNRFLYRKSAICLFPTDIKVVLR
jgi:hypothetical protein